ncbi:MAG: aminotransferase class I/II-fold pyridoxal phosphate-dependent enzyme [Pseudomonadota bacterium]
MNDNNAFTRLIDRTHSSSTKWEKFGPDVLPLWVADMDFPVPQSIMSALQKRLDHPILGYTDRPDSLNAAFLGWLEYHFDWVVPEDWIVWIPGVVPGINLAAQTMLAGQDLVIPTPVYHPFFEVAEFARLAEKRVSCSLNHATGLSEFDWDAMQAGINPNARPNALQTKGMLAIANPQNPTGRCYSATELENLADYVQRNNLLLVSDEIHANIILDTHCRHIPIAKAFPDIAPQTITLLAATKTYNIPGLSCAAAIIPSPQVREAFLNARKGLIPGIGPLGFVASEAAFAERSSWLPDLLEQLRMNYGLIQQQLGSRVSKLEATYLAWIRIDDVLEHRAADAVEAYFADHGVGISPGEQFGDDAFIRVNFGCPQQTLEEGLRRLTAALKS